MGPRCKLVDQDSTILEREELDAEKVRVEPQPGDSERVESTVHQVGEGVLSQDFEPRPSPTVCSWCDYRLVCPAAES